MIEKISSFIYGNSHFSVESDYSLKESMIRLQKEYDEFYNSSYLPQKTVGHITDYSVKMQCFPIMAIFPSMFKPIFIGCFELKNNRTYLSGEFSMHWLVKFLCTLVILTIFFFTSVISIDVFGRISNLSNIDEYSVTLLLSPAIGLAPIVIIIGIIKLGWKMTFSQTEDLKIIIKTSLKKS